MPTHALDQDFTVPLRDAGSATLKRKLSVSTSSGLPAPLPLHGLIHILHEHSASAPLAHMPGAGLGGAGKRTP